MRTRIWYLVSLCLLGACKIDKEEDKAKFHITATTNIMADGVRALVGDSAVVTPIMAVGVDPHLYKASQRDLDLLFEADLVVYHGLHLEGKMVEVLHKFSRTHPAVDVGATLPPTLLIASPDYANTVDPHIWFDVHLWRTAMRNLKDEIIKRKPGWESYINANWEVYQAQLDELDQYTAKKVKSITNQGQVLITAHDAFSYFGKAYNIEVKGLQGLSTLSEPGLNDVSSLVSFIIEKDIKAIFIEQSISPRAIKAVVEGCRRKGHQVTLAGPLYTDSLGAPDGPAGTYIGMVKTNVDEIVNNLKHHDTTNRASGS
ncbi:metal ABC transporter solute-binding protein, Zn/Mn family [Echinicola vietnamensis]|uniref:ABC-type metal ion transport system, periplasmic component/surface adhesin n=1 Tax=Echinicola vietnamensis (strain DSM 17526 / LMG 23754 / KMM 6221) TaxID=926556 RepID=L0G0P1_ECHVK|nr:zinc ABC transporter substrate-binding protein [Echinicola vietnamensis]AGA79764.1 ABC-type metal ion transport system, periplasmic component/surface adhesin [Echinicola vietnamensis DSM 17526]